MLWGLLIAFVFVGICFLIGTHNTYRGYGGCHELNPLYRNKK